MHILGYPSGFLFDKTLDQGAGWEFAVFKVCSSFSWQVKFNQYLYVFLNLSTHSGGSLPLSCRETFVVA